MKPSTVSAPGPNAPEGTMRAEVTSSDVCVTCTSITYKDTVLTVTYHVYLGGVFLGVRTEDIQLLSDTTGPLRNKLDDIVSDVESIVLTGLGLSTSSRGLTAPPLGVEDIVGSARGVSL